MPPSLFRQIGRRGNKSATPNGMLKNALSHPPLPSCPGTHPLPELRSRFERILNGPVGRSRSWPAQGRAGEISVRLRFFFSLRPHWITLFGAFRADLSILPNEDT